jgi:hypothetical protein
MSPASGVSIQNGTVTGFGNGIHLLNSAGDALTNITAARDVTGLLLENAGGSTLTGNTLVDNG